MRTRLAADVDAAALRGADHLHTRERAHVHDMQAAAGLSRELDGISDRGQLRLGRA